jgi:hypothetical protein
MAIVFGALIALAIGLAFATLGNIVNIITKTGFTAFLPMPTKEKDKAINKQEENIDKPIYEKVGTTNKKTGYVIFIIWIVGGILSALISDVWAYVIGGIFFGIVSIPIFSPLIYKPMTERLSQLANWIGDLIAMAGSAATMQQILIKGMEEPPELLVPYKDEIRNALMQGGAQGTKDALKVIADACDISDVDVMMMTLEWAAEGSVQITSILRIIQTKLRSKADIYRRVQLMVSQPLFEIKAMLVLSWFVMLIPQVGLFSKIGSISPIFVNIDTIFITGIIAGALYLAAKSMIPKPNERLYGKAIEEQEKQGAYTI